MSTEFNFHELKVADRLPSPSGTALALMQLVEREDVTTETLANLVKADPALTARLLRMANSPALGVRRPVIAVSDAIILLGTKAVKQFALSLSLVGKYRMGRCQSFEYTSFWAFSLAYAVAIQIITSRDRSVAPEEAFTLGLLAELGRLALATAWPKEYSDVLHEAGNAVDNDSESLLKLERQQFAIDHQSLGEMMLADWRFPAIMLDALNQSLYAERPEQTTRSSHLAHQLAFARAIARHCLAGEKTSLDGLKDLQAQASRHGFEGDEALTHFVAQVQSEWHEWGKLIEIETERPVAELPTAAEVDAGPSKPVIAGVDGLDILLLDDDPIVLAQLSKQLSELGHRVTRCRNATEALKLALENQPNMVITDWHMQPMDGLKLTQILRASSIGQNLYIIMLTATENEDALVRAFEIGIDDYVTKPPNIKVLAARMRAGKRIIDLQQALLKERQEIERYSAELAVSNRRLEMLANTDLLTGLPNRRYALHRLEQEWLAAQRFNRPLSVMMLDLDHFKSINDSLGHAAGDLVLKHASSVMRTSLRGSDIVCRMGGEEFLVIANNTDSAAAVQLAERVRAAIEGEQPENMTLPSPLTVSIGVASTMGAKTLPMDLIKYADKALYWVKQDSRNAVKLASF